MQRMKKGATRHVGISLRPFIGFTVGGQFHGFSSPLMRRNLLRANSNSRNIMTSTPPNIAPVAPSGPNAGVSAMMSPTSSATTPRSEEHTSELQSLMRISYAVLCLKNKKNKHL